MKSGVESGKKELVEGELDLLTETYATAWAGHSERATLPSALAALGVPRDEREHLGRWSPQGADEYVRTYKMLMKKLASTIVKVVESSKAYQLLDEGEAVEDAKHSLIKKGLDPKIAEEECGKLKNRVKLVCEA